MFTLKKEQYQPILPYLKITGDIFSKIPEKQLINAEEAK